MVAKLVPDPLFGGLEVRVGGEVGGDCDVRACSALAMRWRGLEQIQGKWFLIQRGKIHVELGRYIVWVGW